MCIDVSNMNMLFCKVRNIHQLNIVQAAVVVVVAVTSAYPTSTTTSLIRSEVEPSLSHRTSGFRTTQSRPQCVSCSESSDRISRIVSSDQSQKVVLKISIGSLQGNHRLRILEDPDDFYSLCKDREGHGEKVPCSIEIILSKENSNGGDYMKLALTRNDHLITKRLVKRRSTSHLQSESPYPKLHSQHSCYFTGYVTEIVKSYVSISLCPDHVTGSIEVDEQSFYLESTIRNNRYQYFLLQEANYHNVVEHRPLVCGNPRTSTKVKRAAHGPAGRNSKTRFVELYVVVDNALYKRAGSVDAAVSRVINIVNYASGLYKRLNIYLALVGVEVWSDRDKISLRNNISADEVLTQFLNYRKADINHRVLNDNAQLFVGVKLAGSTVGRGSITGMCSHQWSGAVTSDLQESDWRVAATTMAHEMGHNFGLPHDDDINQFGVEDCGCPPGTTGPCVMYSISLKVQPKVFSQCSADWLEREFEYFETDYCLLNEPETLLRSGNTPICGNSLVEEGEQCDCGMPDDCISNCCDAQTCKLHLNATCSTGACCNIDTCDLKKAAFPCRPLSDTECDLPEFCDGLSEWCPSETYKLDGTPCSRQGDAFCFKGKCNTHNSQCEYLWGTNSKSSVDACYDTWNNFSDYFGNCGYKVSQSTLNGSLLLEYLPCGKQSDLMCGLLQCETTSDKLALRIKLFMVYNNRVVVGRTAHPCSVVSLDVGRGEFDPGMVPNGARCGENQMCINHKCEATPTLPSSCDCHDRGSCNQNGNCHCDVGWAPPDCRLRGKGGSIDSGPASFYEQDHSTLVGLLTVFLGVLPMIITVGVICYCKRSEIWHLYQGYKRRKLPKTASRS